MAYSFDTEEHSHSGHCECDNCNPSSTRARADDSAEEISSGAQKSELWGLLQQGIFYSAMGLIALSVGIYQLNQERIAKTGIRNRQPRTIEEIAGERYHIGAPATAVGGGLTVLGGVLLYLSRRAKRE